MHDLEMRVGERARAALASSNKFALFIDVDGTLLGVAPTPDAVRVPAGLIRLLDAVMAGLDGAVAVLTGRRIKDADRLLAPLAFAASGVHGTELRCKPGSPIVLLAPRVPSDVVQALNNISGLASGIIVEQKGSGVAVHYRKAPSAQPVLEREVAAIVAASPHDLVVRRGRKVLEAVPGGFDKGTALVAIAANPPFKGRRPVMIGDDEGDEPAFLAAEQLGGMGLRVAGEHFSADEADFADIYGVRAWLKALADRLTIKAAAAAR